MTAMLVSIDGELVDPAQARVSIFDRGFQFGDGLFETFRTWDGVLVDADEHLARLRASAAALQLQVGPIAIPPGDGERRIKVIVTRGEGGVGVPFGTAGPGHTIVIVEPLGTIVETATAAIVDWPLPRRRVAHKTLAYLDSLIARQLTPATEAIRLDADGNVCEGAMSNVFAVEGDRVITPALGTGALAGVTRAQVIVLAGAREEVVTVERLRCADEIFITSAIRSVCGVVELDGAPRAVGPVTARLREAYAAEMRTRAQQFLAGRGARS